MKTADHLKRKIQENKKFISDNLKTLTSRKHNSLLAEIEKHTELLRYLETNPREEFIKAEKIRLNKIIESKNNQFPTWCQNVCPDDVEVKNRRSLFNKETGLTALKRQLKNIEFILSD